jgi:lipopolysaccharide transport system permease protein
MQVSTTPRHSARPVTPGLPVSVRATARCERLRQGGCHRDYLIEPHSGWPCLAWSEVWTHRELLGFFVWRDVKVRYKQTLLGIAWAVLQPLATMIVFSVVFGRLARLDSDGVAYPAFSLAGLLPWLLFSSGLTLAASSLVGNVNLLTKVYFPRILLPLSNVISALLDFFVSLALLLAVLGWFDIWPTWRVLLVPAPIALALVTAAGAGLWLAALNAQYRDIRHALPFVMQIWMYATPIVYSLSIVPEWWRPLMAINPLVTVVESFRFIMLGTNGLSVGLVTVSCISALALLLSGTWYFRSMERLMADTI